MKTHIPKRLAEHWTPSGEFEPGKCDDGLRFWDLDIGPFRVVVTKRPDEREHRLYAERGDGDIASTLTHPKTFRTLDAAQREGVKWAVALVQHLAETLPKAVEGIVSRDK